MNLEQVGHFIRHPQELQLSHADALKNLASRHPYSSVYALLYLTALANGKSPDLDDALSANAYRLSDRTRLYHLLTRGGTEIESHNGSSIAVDQKAEPEADLQSLQVTEVESGSKSSIAADQEEPERKTEAEIGFDFEKITTAHSLEQYLEVEEVEKLKRTEEGSDEVQKVEIAESAEDVEIVETSPEAQSQEAQSETEEKRSFTSWLRSTGQPVSKSSEPVKPEEPVKQKPNADELIDKFLKEEPSITRSKTEFFSPSRKAKESLSEDAAPVSETLARIYAAQGNYPKAIHVYHQLMLSVPEKKSLFAVRIEELKKKITQ